jgi:hypothetical protein
VGREPELRIPKEVSPVTERVSLEAARGSELITVVMEIFDIHPAALEMSLENGELLRFEADGLFACLLQAQVHLERTGWLLCCQGARPDVWPSGLLAQMSNGREAYHLIAGRKATLEHIVDIFDPADARQVSTIAAQKEYIEALFRPIFGRS